MVVRRKDKTTLLPEALRERIEQQDASPKFKDGEKSLYGIVNKKGKSRKAAREQERAAKKQRKAEHFAHRSHKIDRTEITKRKREEVQDNRPVKRRKVEEATAPISKSVRGPSRPPISTVLSTQGHKKSAFTSEDLSSATRKVKGPAKVVTPSVKASKKHVKAPVVSSPENEEDKETAWLEYQLGVSAEKAGPRRRSYKNLWKEDGLDDLLEGLDGILGAADEDVNDNNSSGSEDAITDEQEGEDEMEEDEESDESDTIGLDIDDELATSEEEVSDESEQSTEKNNEPQGVQVAETKYVPPHLRTSVVTDTEKRARLLRQLKGLMNKLSEQNIGTVITELEQIYREHARNDVTSSLAGIIIDAISSNASLLDNHIALNATLVAALYRIVGIEFAAYFVQEVVKGYESAYGIATTHRQDASDATADIGGKDAQNLLVCIAELYNFEVISCVLVYDIVRALLEKSVGELEVELLLKILRIGGRQLRQDDPLALKDIVQLVTDNVANRKDALSSRTRFMVETLTNLKNNRIKKTDTSSMDTVERMKKMLSGLNKKHHGSHEPLRVTLEDLHSADFKGKWWLVGSGWAGDPLAEHQRTKEVESQQENTSGKPKKPSSSKSQGKSVGSTGSESERLLQLARAQGMNTDIRRSVFVVLMSSDDYVDACDRLSQLSLTEQQQREIVRVLIHCCGNEKAYNPYYALIGHKLLENSHAHRITARFTLWDFLRSIGETGIGQRGDEAFDSTATVSASRTKNMAKFFGWLIARGSFSISALRPIDFTTLQPPTLVFLDTLFYDIFVGSQGPTPILSRAGLTALWQRGETTIIGKQKYDKPHLVKIFMPAVRDADLSRGLGLYLSKFIKRRVGQGEDGERRFFGWAVDVGKEVLEMGSTAQSLKGEAGMEWEE